MIFGRLNRGAAALDKNAPQRREAESADAPPRDVRCALGHVTQMPSARQALVPHSAKVGHLEPDLVTYPLQRTAIVETYMLRQTAVPVHASLQAPGQGIRVAREDQENSSVCQ